MRREKTDDYPCIDINALGVRPNFYRNGEMHFRAYYCPVSVDYYLNTKKPEYPRLLLEGRRLRDEDGQEIKLLTTPAHFGGVRWWFECPHKHCKKRVGKLYWEPIWRRFCCRSCAELEYKTPYYTKDELLQHKIDKICKRIGYNRHHHSYRVKPRYMHQKTFDQICEKLDELESKT